MSNLFAQADIGDLNHVHDASSWMRDAAGDVILNLASGDGFPCLFARNAARRGRLLFAFVNDQSREELARGALALSSYLGREANWDGRIASAQALIVLFNPKTFSAASAEGYHALGWSVLQSWHEHDPASWPGDVPGDPHKPFWSMCFSGTQIFVNMSSPAHRIRRSRNLGQCLTFVINPRERFDQVAGDNPKGRAIRSLIRRRIHAYDGIPHSPVLGSYMAGEIEWRQYGIADTNELPTGACPFSYRGTSS